MKIAGMNKLKKNFDRLAKKYGEDVMKASVAGGQLVRSDAIKSIQAVSSGDVVTRYRNGGQSYEHTASKPGDAPNTDTGNLVKSINVTVKRNGVYVGSYVEYAPHLEFGTKTMRARPWLNPALERNRKNIREQIANALRRVK